MTNSADPDQSASEADWSGSTCLLRWGMSCSAREGLKARKYRLHDSWVCFWYCPMSFGTQVADAMDFWCFLIIWIVAMVTVWWRWESQVLLRLQCRSNFGETDVAPASHPLLSQLYPNHMHIHISCRKRMQSFKMICQNWKRSCAHKTPRVNVDRCTNGWKLARLSPC